ncbi:MAG: CRISP-associated protein Cas1 [Thermoanaerobacterium sp.]|jgi:CRISPR-associated protein Cas1|uniref:type I-B CRISPR-associated endonuclease Cas1b n=1 Tax=Thermodesulfobacterium commune TaxID=1741 RepID=UPI000EE09C2F|nr:CRISP-associated protein Cas1 [Thermoanaerobacterium sp.]HCE79400.1 subtype I-B CRISPR-associated endonuclease Cas1 [Thermodesulfobacterium commune]HCP10207.1 subtype I-B CRISPR-associated endonuclease Cas1 [Thermodesulfobacterium commune]
MRNYYIFSNGRLKRKDNTIYIENEKGEKKAIPIEDVDTIHVFGEVDLNSKVLNFLCQHGKTVHFYNYYGFYSGSLMPRERNVSGHLLVKQVEHYLDSERRFYLAFSFVEGAIFHMLRNLREYKNTEGFQEKIKKELTNAIESKTISELMGCEGRARDVYYEAFNTILKSDFSMEKREKRPPTNPVNALISFANSMIYTTVLNEIYHTQLNPTISYLHEPGHRRYSLSLDIAEIFKPLIADPIIFKLINNNMLRLDDFEEDVNYCYLNDSGRKKFIKEFDQKLTTTIKHRKMKRKVSYRSLIRIECYKLIKHLIGDEVYKPFKAWW